MIAGRAFGYARNLAALAAALILCACPPREAAIKGSGQESGTVESGGESKGPDPRAAFESSGLFGGMAASPVAPVVLIAAAGLPEAGVCLALGESLSMAAIARRVYPPSVGKGFRHELVLASGARASLPGPVLAMAASGERIVVACADASAVGRAFLIDFKTEGEGERLIEAWKTEGYPARRLLAVPGGRIVVADESVGLRLVDASTGAQAWGKSLSTSAADIAYAPGLVLAAAGSSLEAFDESTGASVWSAALTAKARSISAGNGIALVLAESGSLSAFSLIDGKGIGAAPGPFDPSLRPLADGSRAIVALIGGGAAEIEVKSGQTLRTWAWEGTTAFLAADRELVYAGIDGRKGRGILLSSRTGEASQKLARIESPVFDSPEAVSGARGGLLLLLMDGSLVLVGKNREPSATASALDSAIAPPHETAAAISSALGRFKPVDLSDPRPYLRFDIFAQGMPVDTGVAFTAFRYESEASMKRKFAAKPASGAAVIAIFNDTGQEIAASIDELGSSSSAMAYLEKGRVFWIVAGWTFQATPERFRLYVK
jgi:hypothetical protein